MVCVLQTEPLQDRNTALEVIQSPPIFFFTNPQTSPIHLKRIVEIVKILALGNKSPSCGNLHSFPVSLKCDCPILSL